ncbi:MAG: hypothetical protein ACLP0J_08415 [Solirubrobacteraceae bacterium]|jgi:DNA-binding transcriptional MocR family regulator
MRRVYGARRETLIEALSGHASGVALHGLAAKFHAVAQLVPGADESAIVAQARERSIGVMEYARIARAVTTGRRSWCSASGI